MKLIILVIASLLSVNAFAEQSTLKVEVTKATRPVIPANTTSCMARKSADDGDFPAPDIFDAYFSVPMITLTKAHRNSEVEIDAIRVTLPVNGKNYECQLSGNALSALSSNWWKFGGNPSVSMIPSGATTMTTDCAMYCGGLRVDKSFKAKATLEVYGFEIPEGTNRAVELYATTEFSVGN